MTKSDQEKKKKNPIQTKIEPLILTSYFTLSKYY